MSFKSTLFVICFALSCYSVSADEYGPKTMWFAPDGILTQNLQKGADTHTEFVHTIVNSSNISDWEMEDQRKSEIDFAYSTFLNRFISIYVDGKIGDSYSWYVYNDKGKASIPLKRPFNRIHIIVYYSPKDVGSTFFSNVAVLFNFVGKDGIERRRPDQELEGLSTANFERIASAMNRCMKEVGASIPSDGTGFPVYSLDNIVHRGSLLLKEEYRMEGIRPDKVNPPPSGSMNR